MSVPDLFRALRALMFVLFLFESVQEYSTAYAIEISFALLIMEVIPVTMNTLSLYIYLWNAQEYKKNNSFIKQESFVEDKERIQERMLSKRTSKSKRLMKNSYDNGGMVQFQFDDDEEGKSSQNIPDQSDSSNAGSYVIGFQSQNTENRFGTENTIRVTNIIKNVNKGQSDQSNRDISDIMPQYSLNSEIG